MFKCYNCGELSKPREASHSFVLGSRKKDYINYKRRNPFIREEDDTDRIIRSTGWEITKEGKFCLTCYNKFKEKQDV